MKALYYSSILLSLAFVGPELALGDTQSTTSSSQTLQNNAYVTLTGTVSAITDGDEFTLNYGGGQIRVDTNDAWPNLFKRDANNAGRALNEGDRVIVTGRMDDNWFGNRELDAYSVRHERGGQVFDYESASRTGNPPSLSNLGLDFGQRDRVSVTGTITEAVNANRYKMSYSDGSSIEIDTTGITGGKNQHFSAGERVRVTGTLDNSFFGKREINVDTIQRTDSASR